MGIAEELIFGAENVTTGASNDFMQVTRTAKMMITQMGFSDQLGQLNYGGGGGPSFLGGEMGQGSDFSGETADVIDGEVKALVNRAYRRAKDLLQTNIEVLHDVAQKLIEKENMDGDVPFSSKRSSGRISASLRGPRLPKSMNRT